MSDVPPSVDIHYPNAARIYDYALGGNHNFEVDREFAERMWAETGYSPLGYQLNRSFLRRAVRFMIDQGIDQFLDLGSGIPTIGNVHEIAHSVNPAARVVYVDNEPIAVAHARQLLGNIHNATIVDVDMRDVVGVLEHSETRRLLDFDRPVGLFMVAVLHFIPEDADPVRLVSRYRSAMTAGGFLALTHFTSDGSQSGDSAKSEQWYQRTTTPVMTRTAAELRKILGGWDLVEPGLVWTPQWRPDPGEPGPAKVEDAAMYGAVGSCAGAGSSG